MRGRTPLLGQAPEHELHHRGQIWAYLRQMGRTPPFYALPLPLGERPDHAAREELGGF